MHFLRRKAVVVGAGYIAVEMAGILKSLGSEVSQLIRYESVLRNFDTLCSTAVTKEIETMGIDLRRRTNVSQKLNLKLDFISQHLSHVSLLNNFYQ